MHRHTSDLILFSPLMAWFVVQEAILANVVEGLRCYLGAFGDTRVPQGFVVPDGEAWPAECRGQKLGLFLFCVGVGFTYAAMLLLLMMMFVCMFLEFGVGFGCWQVGEARC